MSRKNKINLKSKRKNILNSERGSITIYVIITMLFFSVFIMSIYIINSRKYETQLEANAKVKAIYEKESATQEFNSRFASEDEKIPIYTEEQLLKIGSGECIYIPQEEKMYFFVNDRDKYIIKNNITGLNRNTVLGMLEKFTFSIENYGSGENQYHINGTEMLKNE